MNIKTGKCFFAVLIVLCVKAFALDYHDRENGYTIFIPRGWKIEKDKNSRVALKCQGPASAGFNANFNVMISDLPDSISYEEFYDNINKTFARMFPAYNAHPYDMLQVNEMSGMWFVGEYAMGVQDIGLSIYLFRKTQKGYMITFTYDKSSADEMNQAVENVIAGFKLDDKRDERK